MKIYIAGPITGNKDYIKQFKRAENRLKKQGHTVINPVESEGFMYDEYLDMGIVKLSKCNGIYLLDGFRYSKGAKFELIYAVLTKKKIICENFKDQSYVKGVREKWK